MKKIIRFRNWVRKKIKNFENLIPKPRIVGISTDFIKTGNNSVITVTGEFFNPNTEIILKGLKNYTLSQKYVNTNTIQVILTVLEEGVFTLNTKYSSSKNIISKIVKFETFTPVPYNYNNFSYNNNLVLNEKENTLTTGNGFADWSRNVYYKEDTTSYLPVSFNDEVEITFERMPINGYGTLFLGFTLNPNNYSFSQMPFFAYFYSKRITPRSFTSSLNSSYPTINNDKFKITYDGKGNFKLFQNENLIGEKYYEFNKLSIITHLYSNVIVKNLIINHAKN